MTRILQFRAYNKRHKQMVYNIAPIGGEAYITDEELMPESGMILVGPESVIEQFTGLTDKNGTEIYEGDIVYRHVHWNECKHRDHTNYDKQKGCNDRGDEYEEVKFENGTFHWFPYWVQADDWEVIGNIHENPNLLGGKYS